MRTKQFYVSADVWRAYWMLSRSAPASTPDQIADNVLRKHIEDNCPQLFTHQKEVDALEKTLIAELKNQ